MDEVPSIVELMDARKVVSAHHPRTPLYFSESLSRRSECEVYVKFENHSPIRSFKARGALYSLWRMSSEHKQRGVVTASTGNHGQGIAYAGKVFGIPVTIVVPNNTSDTKCASIQSWGGKLVFFGDNVSQAMLHAHHVSQESNQVYLEDGNDCGLMAGAATVAWEILEDVPAVSTIVVPVGGGNLIAAVSLVAKKLNPEIRVVGVQSEAAPAATLSWRAKRIVDAPCETSAEGLATTFPGELALQVLKDGADEMLLVSEEDLATAIVTVLIHTGQIAEAAGAAPFAALDKFGTQWTGRKVVLVLSGGNLPPGALTSLLLNRGMSG